MKNAFWGLLLKCVIGNCLVTPMALAASGSPGGAKGAQGARQGYAEGFDVKRAPATGDWRYFLKAPPATRARLWAYHSKRGVTLGQWAWGWRMGWLRSCGNSTEAYCDGILSAGLFDKALVVRAEAATLIGRRFEGTSNPAAIKQLERAYADPRNMRAGQPIFVQERILFAMHRIGGDVAAQSGANLSRRHPKMATYWGRLGRATAR